MRAARYLAASRRHRTFANGKIPAARPSRHSDEFRLILEQSGNALPGDRARRSCRNGVPGLPSGELWLLSLDTW